MNRIITGLSLGLCTLLFAQAQQQQKLGAPYQTREPDTCTSTKDPAKGTPSPEVIKHYLRCHIEGVGPGPAMYLIENINVELGKGTPFMQLDRGSRPFEADPDGLVYPIRGSYIEYQCAAPNSINNNYGKNCNKTLHKHASGVCFRSGFGDWTCNMSDLNALNYPDNETNVPGPR